MSVGNNFHSGVKKETVRLTYAVSVMTIMMWIGFYFFHRQYPTYVPFDYRVLLAGMGGALIAVGNFYLMGKSLEDMMKKRERFHGEKEDQDGLTRMRIKSGYTYRTLLQMAWVIIALTVPVFQPAAGIIPIFFPGIWFKVRMVKKEWN